MAIKIEKIEGTDQHWSEEKCFGYRFQCLVLAEHHPHTHCTCFDEYEDDGYAESQHLPIWEENLELYEFHEFTLSHQLSTTSGEIGERVFNPEQFFPIEEIAQQVDGEGRIFKQYGTKKLLYCCKST